MTGRRSLIALSLLSGALAAFAAQGCGESGQTPTCPALSLYDINAAGAANDPKVAAERARAVDAGCMTDLDDAAVELPDASVVSPLPDGALPDGALPVGALPDGALPGTP